MFDDRLGAHLRLVWVLPGFPPRATLTEQIPALVELHFEFREARAVFFRELPLAGYCR